MNLLNKKERIKMPTVVIRHFEVEKKQDHFEKAKVSGRVYFTPGEKVRNIGFCVKANLCESDDGIGTYQLSTDSHMKGSTGNTDDPIGLIGATHMSPDGDSFKDFSFEQTWNAYSVINSSRRSEKCCAIVWALPDVCGDVAISPQIDSNLI